jgi:hypothetical protein
MGNMQNKVESKFNIGVFVVKVTIQVQSVFTECGFLVRIQKIILWSIRFNVCQVLYLVSHKKRTFPNKNSMTTGLKYRQSVGPSNTESNLYSRSVRFNFRPTPPTFVVVLVSLGKFTLN